jgi:hypothetical protein
MKEKSENATSQHIPSLDSAVPARNASQEAANYAFPANVQPRNQPHITVSTVTTTAKLIKLKAELLNILYSFPEKALKWPELDQESESLIQSAGEAAANNVLAATAQIISAAQGQPVDIKRMAEKASKKARRRLRRKLALEQFTRGVTSAISPADLLKQVILLENSVPPYLSFFSLRASLPTEASTAADVALRLYSLDRMIAYDEITCIENAAAVSTHKLRLQFCPRCYLNPSCVRQLGHSARCSPGSAVVSRLPDHFQLSPPGEGLVAPSQSVGRDNLNEAKRSAAATTLPRPPQQRHVEEILPRLSSFFGKDGIDIEVIQPYIPNTQEVPVSQWL